MALLSTSPSAGSLPAGPAGLPRRGPGRALALGLVLLAGGALVLGGCGGPRPKGELLGIQDDQYSIAHPGIIGASATGRACGVTAKKALTSARRIAHFNLRTLTGGARYGVRFDPVSTTRDAQGVCVEVSATAVPPEPYDR